MISFQNGLDSTPAVAITTGITDLLDEYKDVFEGLGDLPGEYHIGTDDAEPPYGTYIHLAMYQWLYKTRSKRNCMRW